MKRFDKVCLAIVITISITCGYFALCSIAEEKRKNLEEKDLLSMKLKDLDLANTSLEELKRILAATREELKIINEQIPETADIGTFLKTIDSLMNDREDVVINVEPQPSIREAHYSRIPIQMGFEGRFSDVYKILYGLETMNRLIVMENIDISKSNTGKHCQVSLTTNIFKR